MNGAHRAKRHFLAVGLMACMVGLGAPLLGVGMMQAEAERLLTGGLILDGSQTVWWSPEMISDRMPPKATPVYVTTFVNTLDGPREVVLQAWMPVRAKDGE